MRSRNRYDCLLEHHVERPKHFCLVKVNFEEREAVFDVFESVVQGSSSDCIGWLWHIPKYCP